MGVPQMGNTTFLKIQYLDSHAFRKKGYRIVNDLDIDEFSQKMIDITLNELIEEQKAVDSLLKG